MKSWILPFVFATAVVGCGPASRTVIEPQAPPPPVDNAAGPAAQVGVSIFTSIQRLGLRLDSQKRPLDTIVVDAGQRDPIEN